MKRNLKHSLAALAATALLIPLSACGSSNEPIRADDAIQAAPVATPLPKTQAPPAVATVGADAKTGRTDWCANIDASKVTTTTDLAAHWSKADLAEANCAALTAIGEVGYTSLALPNAASSADQIVETVRPWLTERGLAEVRSIAKKAVTKDGDEQADRDLGALVGGFNLTNPKFDLRAVRDADQPIVGQQQWTASDLNLDSTKDAAQNPRLDVTFTWTADLLLARMTDGAPYVVKQTRHLTVAMSQTGVKGHEWLIDGWDADSIAYATPVKDAHGPTLKATS